MRDLLIIGGGINGAGIARDAAGRGLSVILCEKDDLAAHTSSASTKLVHGGLRYLEHYEFRLVRESLQEREILLRNAPHIIWPLRFVLPHETGLRPKWMLQAGLILYDRLGGKGSLPKSRRIDLANSPHRPILKERFTTGFEYSDCWVEDSRLVVLTAMDARERGANIRTRSEVTALERLPDRWRARLTGPEGTEDIVETRAIANAAGPWVDDLAQMGLKGEAKPHLRLVKGSHIVVPRKFPGEQAYIFQNGDGRIVFAIPYEREFTLIGTTDLLFTGDRDRPEISQGEIDYLCAAASEYFRSPITPDEVVSTYSGIRPLYEDHSARNSTVTRDYVFELDSDGGAPLLSVYGGKITTYRRLAEHALEKLLPHFGIDAQAWTASVPLPGGDMPEADFQSFLWQASERWDWLPPEMLLRLARAYGTRLERVLAGAASLATLGKCFAGDLYEAELRYLMDEEFARTAEDILWRRSKLGLHLRPDISSVIDQWIAAR